MFRSVTFRHQGARPIPPTTTTNSGKLFIGQIRPQALAFLRRSLLSWIIKDASFCFLSVGMHRICNAFTHPWKLWWKRNLSLAISLLSGRRKESPYILLLPIYLSAWWWARPAKSIFNKSLRHLTDLSPKFCRIWEFEILRRFLIGVALLRISGM